MHLEEANPLPPLRTGRHIVFNDPISSSVDLEILPVNSGQQGTDALDNGFIMDDDEDSEEEPDEFYV